MTLNKRIIYQPIKAEVIRRFARTVGAQLAEQQQDERYADQVNVDGLADFLEILNDLLVKNLNSKSDQGIA